MNEDSFVASLASDLPSERMRAAQWALENPLDDGLRRVLVEAASKEGVPRIRNVIGLVLRKLDAVSEQALVESVSSEKPENAIVEILEELSGIISHEMEPAIGRVRLAAFRDIEGFEASATNQAVEALRKRVDGVVSLAAAYRLPVRGVVSLTEILNSCISLEYPSSLFVFEGHDGPSDEIQTDPGLLSLLLTNAIQNAADAARDIPDGKGQIFISLNMTETTFWLTISNRFMGASFDYTLMRVPRRSSKIGHRGLGVRVMSLAASRLGYEFELKASGGTATCSIRGSRFA